MTRTYTLGIAFLRQGERTGSPSGIDLLKMALIAFDGALEVRTSEEMPQSWAATQSNRGLTNEVMGDMTEGEKRATHWRAAEVIYRDVFEFRRLLGADSAQTGTEQNLARIQQKIASLSKATPKPN